MQINLLGALFWRVLLLAPRDNDTVFLETEKWGESEEEGEGGTKGWREGV